MPLPPGPRRPRLVQALAFGADPYGFLDRCARDFGETFTLRFPAMPPSVTTSNPEIVRRVFAMKPREFRSHRQPLPVDLGARSLIFQDDAVHRQQRKLMAPPLQAKRVREYGRIIAELADEHIASWPQETSFGLYPRLQKLALEVLLRCVFGVEPHSERERVLAGLILDWARWAMSPAVAALSLGFCGSRVRQSFAGLAEFARSPLGQRLARLNPMGTRKVALVDWLRAEVEALVHEGTDGRMDVMASFVEARDEDGGRLSPDEIVDQLVTLIVGGHETTAHAISWALQLVYSHPRVLERLREELDAHSDEEGTGSLPYLDATLRESMRLRPVFAVSGRLLTEPMDIAGYEVPADTFVWPSIYLVQQRSDLWDRPSEFRPERFLEGTPAPFAFVPFGGGVRRCIGDHLASFEMAVIVRRVVSKLDLNVPNKVQARLRGFSIAPTDALPVTSRPRQTARPTASVAAAI